MTRLFLAAFLGLSLAPAVASAGHDDDYGCEDDQGYSDVDCGGYDDGDRYEGYRRSYQSHRYYAPRYRDYDDDDGVYHHVHRRVHHHYSDHGDHYHVRHHVHRRVHHHYDD